ncbi:MAG: triose-phosphate isomerase [Thermoplasmatales archaeon]|nr:triose-phosphate isomerase [Thermoplasmatales archaeon]
MRRPLGRAAPLGAPILIVNLKAYPTALGPGALRIGRALEELGTSADVDVAIAPSAPDLALLATSLRIPVLAQQVDASPPGARTGRTVESLRASGVRGSLVNHSECPEPAGKVPAIVSRLSKVGLAAVVCAGDLRTAGQLARSRPQYLAIEPPELIGGDRAVSSARPEIVSGAVERVRRVSRRTLVLCGAGVHDRRDVRRALELGSQGVLVASAVALARRPRRAIVELLAGFER